MLGHTEPIIIHSSTPTASGLWLLKAAILVERKVTILTSSSVTAVSLCRPHQEGRQLIPTGSDRMRKSWPRKFRSPE